MWSHPHVSSEQFREWVEEAIDSLPGELHDAMSNVAIVVDEEAPPEQNVLGLYQGIPLTRRNSGYAAVPPDKITIFRRPIERVVGTDPARLRDQVHHVVIHEIAHHFGISDEWLIELGKY